MHGKMEGRGGVRRDRRGYERNTLEQQQNEEKERQGGRERERESKSVQLLSPGFRRFIQLCVCVSECVHASVSVCVCMHVAYLRVCMFVYMSVCDTRLNLCA